MSNVHEFPADRQLQKKLENLQDELSELYDNLHRCFEILNRIEDTLAEKEDHYNNALERYGHAVGMENIPVGYLEYATKNISLDMEGSEITFKWEPESEEPGEEV
jgi:DNA anti-recombination protein RmuC